MTGVEALGTTVVIEDGQIDLRCSFRPRCVHSQLMSSLLLPFLAMV